MRQTDRQTVGMCGIDFLISVWFRFGSWKKLGFGSESIWFGSVCKNSVRFGYLFTTDVG